MKIRKCTLLITYSCNLNCIYCYERHKTSDKSKTMSFDTARKIIPDEIGTSGEFDKTEFNFFGGEPLLHFDLIRRIVEWAEHESITSRCFFTATTNGTLITDNVKEWCVKHRDNFALGLSLDGIDDVQKLNRGCRSEHIPAEFVRTTWPERPFKMTISRNSLPTLAKNVIGLQQAGYRFVSSLAEGTDWTDGDAEEYGRQLQILANHYLLHRDEKPMHLFLRSLQTVIDGQDKPQRKMCGIGDYSVAYDYDGTLYPCISLTPIVTDTTYPNADFSAESADFQDEECKGCILINDCPTCYGQNLINRKSFAARDHSKCKMYKTELREVARLQLDYLQKYDILTPEQQKRADNAKYILKLLQNI